MRLGSLDRQAVLSLNPGDEPISGFRLIRRRGRGGFGEVWEAEAPGQYVVALKFVRLSSQARAAELRALDFVRGIHHPNLLANFGAWQVDETLVIGMELADGSLWDRFLAATQLGDRGIPRGELLGYLSDVAAGIDYLNSYTHTIEGRSKIGIQHRDLKPPNILLFGGGAKVADLGMARAMEGEVTGHTGIYTFPYAAPEFFREQTTHQSDQYGLAVTYCQLRGGQLPFGGSAASVAAGHLFAQPNLDALPMPERPIVARALSKSAHDRWPNCGAFIEALRALPVSEVPDRLVDHAALGDFSGDSNRRTNSSFHFVPEDSGSECMAIPSGWLPDTADSGSDFSMPPHTTPSSVSGPMPLVGHDFSLWSSFNSTLVMPAQPANSWGDIDSRPRNRSAQAIRHPVGLASFLGLVLAFLAMSGSQSEPQAGHGKPPVASPIVSRRPIDLAPEPIGLADPLSADLPLPPQLETATSAPPEPDLTAINEMTRPANPVTTLADGTPDTVATTATARPLPDLALAVPNLASPAPPVEADRPNLMLEGPREMMASPADPGGTTVDRDEPMGTAPRAVALASTPNPVEALSLRVASRVSTAGPTLDQSLRLTRDSLAVSGRGDPKAAEAAYARGRELFRQSDFPAAIRAFDESIRLNPGHATPYLARAITHDRSGDPRAALVDYSEVIRVRPDDASVYIARGQIHHELSEYDQAIADFDRAIQLQPTVGDPRFRRGLARYRAGDYTGASDDFIATLSLDPQNPYAAGFRDESEARLQAQSGQTPTTPTPTPKPNPPQSIAPVTLVKQTAHAIPRSNLDGVSSPVRETTHFAPPPATGPPPGIPPSSAPSTRTPTTAARSASSPPKIPDRRVPVLRRLLPWPLRKAK